MSSIAVTRSGRGTPSYGWAMVVIAAICMGLGSGMMVSVSVFLKPLVAEFGWQRGQASSAYLAATLVHGLGGIALGYLADRFSTRPVVLAGALGLGVTLLLLGRQTSLWQFIALSGLLGLTGSAAFFAPLTAAVAGWFQHNRGLALGLTTAGHALGQGLVVVLGRILIETLGWRGAYEALGWVALALLVPLALAVRDAPRLEAAPGKAAGAPVEAAHAMARARAKRIPRPVLLAWVAGALVTCCLAMASPVVHGVALATDRGIAPTAAASVMLTLLGAGVVGRIGFGRLADAIGGLRAYGIASVGQTALVFWFTQVHSLAAFHVLAAVFGMASSGLMTAMLHAVREMAPAGRQASSTAVVVLFGATGMGLGGTLGGVLYDLTGSYTLPFALSAVAGMVNGLLVLAMMAYLYRGPRRWRPAETRQAGTPAYANAYAAGAVAPSAA